MQPWETRQGLANVPNKLYLKRNRKSTLGDGLGEGKKEGREGPEEGKEKKQTQRECLLSDETMFYIQKKRR